MKCVKNKCVKNKSTQNRFYIFSRVCIHASKHNGKLIEKTYITYNEEDAYEGMVGRGVQDESGKD